MTDRRMLFRSMRGLGAFGRNVAALFTGSAAAAVLTLVAMAIVARNLGPVAFGQFSLIVAYIFVIDGLVSFQSWQAIIKFGTDALHRGHEREFCALLRVGTLIDVSTAIVATTFGALVVHFVGRFLGLGGVETLAAAGCVVLLSRITGSSVAVLRMRGRFAVIAVQQAVVAAIRLALIAAMAVAQPTLDSFIIVWLMAEAIGNLALVALGWRSLSPTEREGMMHGSLAVLAPIRAAAVRFLWTSNLHSTVKLTLRELDMLAVGAMLGPQSAGLYRVVKQIASVAGKVMSPLYQVVYPDLAREFALGDRQNFWRLVLIPGMALGMAVLAGVGVFWIWGALLIDAVLGVEYVQAAVPTTIYLLATAVSALTVGFQPAALALGEAMRSLQMLSVSVVIYVAAFLVLANEHGLEGVAWSYVVFYVTWATLMSQMLKRASARAPWQSTGQQ